MKQINFIVCEMTYVRYFIPLVIEGNKRGMKSIFFIGRTGKYNSPHKHQKSLNDLSKKYNFELRDMSSLEDNGWPFFLIEGVQSKLLSGFKSKKYSLTYMTDFVGQYEKYIDAVDYVIFPSQFMAEHYKKAPQKSLYLGSPKYDISFNKKEIYKKYDINTDKKKAFIILPRQRDIRSTDFNLIYDSLQELGFSLITKTRGKDPITKGRQDYHFMDFSWYPHDSMELIHISDLVINFSSTAIKECVILKKPLINFHIKPFEKPLKFLYEYDYCENFGQKVDKKELQDAIIRLTGKSLENEFDKAIKNHLFTGNSSKRILDKLCE